MMRKVFDNLAPACLLVMACTIGADAADASGMCPRATCLSARDINGIKLDMTRSEVAQRFPGGIKYIGSDQYEDEDGGISYNFGFSATGHLYRIDSSQNLGKFIPDRAFGLQLLHKLEAKYGPTENSMLPDGGAGWNFYAYCTTNLGTRITCQTESLNVMLAGGYGQPVELQMKLMDFRIMGRDEAKQNSSPKSQAERQMRF